MIQPVALLFKLWQKAARIEVLLFENTDMTIEGTLIGFDEFMNLVLVDAQEVYAKPKAHIAGDGRSRRLGRMLLKGDNITLVKEASASAAGH